MKKRFFAAVLLGLIPLVIAGYLILFGQRIYHSEASLLLRLGRENVALDPTATTGEVVNFQRDRESEVKTTLGILMSRKIAEAVVAKVGADAILAGATSQAEGDARRPNRFRTLTEFVPQLDPIGAEEAAIKELFGNIGVRADRNSNILQVEYRTKSSRLAQTVVQTWVDVFLKKHPELNRTKGSFEFFTRQVSELSHTLNEARSQLQKTKNSAGVVTIEAQRALMTEQISSSKRRQSDLQAQLVASQTRGDQLAQLLKTIDSKIVLEERSGLSNQATDGMRQLLYELQIRSKGVEAKYTENHPLVAMASDQLKQATEIAQAQEAGRMETTQGSNPAYWNIFERLVIEKANRAAIEAELTQIENEISSLGHDLIVMNNRELEIVALNQQVEVLDARYRAIHGKLEEARIDEELQNQRITSINVVQDASFEEQPVSPRKKLCALLGVVGSFAGFLAPWLLGYREPNSSHEAPAQRPKASERSRDPSTAQIRSLQPR